MMSDRPFTAPGRGRKDKDGIEWWACDPYPTWFRHEGVELILPEEEPDWAIEINDESEIKDARASTNALTEQGLAGLDEIIATITSDPAMQEKLPPDWLDRCKKARQLLVEVQEEMNKGEDQ